MKQSCLAVRELQAGAVALIKERKTVVRVAESHSFSWKGWDERKTYSITFDNGIQFPTASEKKQTKPKQKQKNQTNKNRQTKKTKTKTKNQTTRNILQKTSQHFFYSFCTLVHYSTNNHIVLLCNKTILQYVTCWWEDLKP